MSIKQIIRISGKAHQVFPLLALLAKYRGKETLEQIIKEKGG